MMDADSIIKFYCMGQRLRSRRNLSGMAEMDTAVSQNQIATSSKRIQCEIAVPTERYTTCITAPCRENVRQEYRRTRY